MDKLQSRTGPDLDTLEGFEAKIEALVANQVDVNTFNHNYRTNNLAPYHSELYKINGAIGELHQSQLIQERMSKKGLDSEAMELIVKEIVAMRYTMGLEQRLPTDVDSAWKLLKAIYDALERLLVIVKLYRALSPAVLAGIPARRITRGGVASILNFRSIH